LASTLRENRRSTKTYRVYRKDFVIFEMICDGFRAHGSERYKVMAETGAIASKHPFHLPIFSLLVP
jgi:hypothetical protein